MEYSRSLEHAADLARDAAKKGDVVIAAGGDGMVGGLAGALAGTDAVLGILPAGRGNDFARQLALPEEPDRLAELLLSAEPRTIDAIEVDTGDGPHVVVGSVYGGVDSVANAHINRLTRLPGSLAYYLGPLRAIATWRPVSYKITVDGETREERGYTVVAANSGYYGYGLHVAPDAAIDDGLLDVVIIRHAPQRLFFTVDARAAARHARTPAGDRGAARPRGADRGGPRRSRTAATANCSARCRSRSGCCPERSR